MRKRTIATLLTRYKDMIVDVMNDLDDILQKIEELSDRLEDEDDEEAM